MDKFPQGNNPLEEKDQADMLEFGHAMQTLHDPMSTDAVDKVRMRVLAYHQRVAAQPEQPMHTSTISQSTPHRVFFTGLQRFAAAAAVFFVVGAIGVAANENLRNSVIDTIVPKGSLVVLADPPEEQVRVWVDGQERGTTPLEIGRISTGNHTLKVQKDNYGEGVQEVFIEARKTTSVTITFDDIKAYPEKGNQVEIKLKPSSEPTPLHMQNSQATVSVTASSYLTEGSREFFPYKVHDGSERTAWVEGKDGAGVGEWIELSFPQQELSQISLLSGYTISQTLWAENNRPKDVTLVFSDGTKENHTLTDSSSWQTITFGKTITTSKVRLVLNSVYKGNKFDDTCISEIRIKPGVLENISTNSTTFQNYDPRETLQALVDSPTGKKNITSVVRKTDTEFIVRYEEESFVNDNQPVTFVGQRDGKALLKMCPPPGGSCASYIMQKNSDQQWIITEEIGISIIYNYFQGKLYKTENQKLSTLCNDVADYFSNTNGYDSFVVGEVRNDSCTIKESKGDAKIVLTNLQKRDTVTLVTVTFTDPTMQYPRTEMFGTFGLLYAQHDNDGLNQDYDAQYYMYDSPLAATVKILFSR
ncbi:MAG: PEGA domain-containing protein [bacterium]